VHFGAVICGVKPLPRVGFEIGRCVNVQWEQRDLLWEVRRKNEKIQNNIPLDGNEPSITFEEFAEWNVRYPID
jgi:hypothetical protein